jgi:hypothetical protein
MITLLGTLIGFISSIIPDLVKLFQEQRDQKHERELLELQMQQQRNGFTQRLEEIQVQADVAESKALYKTWTSGIAWVDALNGTVRPVLAYSFFLLYCSVKVMQFSVIDWHHPLPWQLEVLWNPEDQAIFAGIIAFYFGQRAMGKIRRA